MMAVPENHFIGNSLNEVALCLEEHQMMQVKVINCMPTEAVTYPVFDVLKKINNDSMIYIPHFRGYYQVKIVRG